MQIRELTRDDAAAAVAMSRDAFGGPLPPPEAMLIGPAVIRWGMFDGSVLAAKLAVRDYSSVIRGRKVRTAGIGGVVVGPEYRARGLAQTLMTHALRAARDRGAAISTLFRTAPQLYRRLGYEHIAEQLQVELPAAALSGLRVPQGIVTRRAGPADAAAIRAVYGEIAAGSTGLLTRTGPAFPATADELVAAFDGITLACDPDGAVLGYASWHRGEGWGAAATLAVSDLLALTGPAHTALLAVLGSFAPITWTIRIRTSGTDPIGWAIPGAGWRVTDVQPYMLRVLDVAAAVGAAGWPAVTREVVVRLDDPVLPWNSGRFVLRVADGAGSVGPAPEPAPERAADDLVLTPNGFAVLLAGGATAAQLRRGGLLGGGAPGSDAALDAMTAGPRPAILDFF